MQRHIKKKNARNSTKRDIRLEGTKEPLSDSAANRWISAIPQYFQSNEPRIKVKRSSKHSSYLKRQSRVLYLLTLAWTSTLCLSMIRRLAITVVLCVAG